MIERDPTHGDVLEMQLSIRIPIAAYRCLEDSEPSEPTFASASRAVKESAVNRRRTYRIRVLIGMPWQMQGGRSKNILQWISLAARLRRNHAEDGWD